MWSLVTFAHLSSHQYKFYCIKIPYHLFGGDAAVLSTSWHKLVNHLNVFNGNRSIFEPDMSWIINHPCDHQPPAWLVTHNHQQNDCLDSRHATLIKSQNNSKLLWLRRLPGKKRPDPRPGWYKILPLWLLSLVKLSKRIIYPQMNADPKSWTDHFLSLCGHNYPGVS